MKSEKIYTTIGFLWLAHFLVDFMIGIWPVYKTITGLDLGIAGLIAASCAFLGEGTQLLFGPLNDKGYTKLLIILGVFFAASSTFLSYTDNYFLLFMLYLLTCLGSGAFHPAAVGLAGSLTRERKALFITIFASGGALGMSSSQLIFSNTYHFLEGQTIWLAIPPLTFVILVSLFALKGLKASAGHTDFKTVFRFFRDKNLTLLYFTQVCNQMIAWALIFLLPDTLICRGHESWLCFGGGHLFLVIGGALMMIPSGYLADKYTPRLVILVASILGMTFFYTFLFVPALSTGGAVILLFLMGASIQVINPVILAFGNRLVPQNPGAISAFLMGLAWCVSEVVGPGGGGLLTKLFEEDAPAKSLTILGGGFGIGIVLTCLLPKGYSQSVNA
jgi:MFS transporter, FSR family, fosmidomycin resistance protein